MCTRIERLTLANSDERWWQGYLRALMGLSLICVLVMAISWFFWLTPRHNMSPVEVLICFFPLIMCFWANLAFSDEARRRGTDTQRRVSHTRQGVGLAVFTVWLMQVIPHEAPLTRSHSLRTMVVLPTLLFCLWTVASAGALSGFSRVRGARVSAPDE